jgi:hypothetical protein
MNTIDIDTSAFDDINTHNYRLVNLHGFGLGFVAGVAVVVLGWALCGCAAQSEAGSEPDTSTAPDAGPPVVAPFTPSGAYVVTYDSAGACATPSTGTVVDSTGILSPYHDGTVLPGGWTCTDSASFAGSTESVVRSCVLGAGVMSFRLSGSIVWSSADDGIGTWTDIDTAHDGGTCSVSISAVYSRSVD